MYRLQLEEKKNKEEHIKIMEEERKRHQKEMKDLEDMQNYYEKQNNDFMKQIKEEYNLRKKKYDEIANQSKIKRNRDHQAYLKKMEILEKSIKEKEIKTQNEIDKLKRESEIILRNIKIKYEEELKNLNLKNKKNIEDLQKQYQNRVNERASMINQLLE